MADEQAKAEAAQSRIQAALAADVPNIYFNGFTNSLTSGDVMMVLERNGKPVAVVNTSYTVAKTLAVKLGGLVANLELVTERSMLTTDDVEGSLNKVPAGKKN